MLHNFLQAVQGTWPTFKYYFSGVGIFVLLEMIIPAEKNQPWSNKLMTVIFSFISILAFPFVTYFPTHYVSEPIFKAMGHPLVTLDLDGFVANGPLRWMIKNILFPFAPMLIVDFFYYWTHRLQHTIPAIWAEHKLHHMDYSLCAATNFRHHWLEDVVRIFTLWIPLGIFAKITPVTGSFLLPFIAYQSFFIHANIKLPLGPLNRIFVGPQNHRIHHSASPNHFDKNFAAIFPVWDIIFGTYYHPQKGEWPKTGMEDGERVRGVLHGLTMPFGMWFDSLRRAFRTAGPASK